MQHLFLSLADIGEPLCVVSNKSLERLCAHVRRNIAHAEVYTRTLPPRIIGPLNKRQLYTNRFFSKRKKYYFVFSFYPKSFEKINRCRIFVLLRHVIGFLSKHVITNTSSYISCNCLEKWSLPFDIYRQISKDIFPRVLESSLTVDTL
jgi:hypothetical protein